jgi:hypothetical protein
MLICLRQYLRVRLTLELIEEGKLSDKMCPTPEEMARYLTSVKKRIRAVRKL